MKIVIGTYYGDDEYNKDFDNDGNDSDGDDDHDDDDDFVFLTFGP